MLGILANNNLNFKTKPLSIIQLALYNLIATVYM